VALSLITSHFHLQQSAARLGLNVLHWLGFTMVDMPSINGFGAPVVGGAAWSLAYEWWFYLALPVMGLVVGVKKERASLLVASGVMTILAAYWITAHGGWRITATFLGGWLAVFVARRPIVTRALTAPIAGVVALAAAALATRMTHGFQWPTTVLLTVSFVVIASGNTLFGVLTSRPVRILGEMGYSVYLLHGIVLFIAFGLMGGAAAHLTPVQHWLVASAGVAATVIVCRVTFKTIEAPAMAAVDRTTVRLREPQVS